ncbi:MAG: TlpA family protein disulfide reductase [Acidimicrobiales bacterium]|nr:TlpA family protein disulfide reductase [Acidimicrobiales bacterium]
MDVPDDAPGPTPRRRLALVASGIAVVVLLALLVATFVVDKGKDETAPEGASTAEAVPERPGKPDVEGMLDTRLLTPEGRSVTLREELDGRPVLVNQWSKTCAPCVEEMPWLEQISKTNPQVKILGVNNLDGLGDATTRAEQTGITYEWVRDPAGDFAHAARTVGLPDTMLFSADGKLLASKIGKFENRAAIQRFLDSNGAGRSDGPGVGS